MSEKLTVEQRVEELEKAVEHLAAILKAHVHDSNGAAIIVQKL